MIVSIVAVAVCEEDGMAQDGCPLGDESHGLIGAVAFVVVAASCDGDDVGDDWTCCYCCCCYCCCSSADCITVIIIIIDAAFLFIIAPRLRIRGGRGGQTTVL